MGPKNKATPGGSRPSDAEHRPVLLHPLIESLQPRAGDVVVDATFGGGGVTSALLERVQPGGHVIAIDRDQSALDRRRSDFEDKPVSLVWGNFADLEKLVTGTGLDQVSAIDFDLGISSLQLDDPDRGFSFRFDAPLDMRMDVNETTTAADIVNDYDDVALTQVIRDYGDERFARSIANAIIKRRAVSPLTSTFSLRDTVAAAIPRRFWPKRIHPATKTFQALRIEVNQELRSLEMGLQAAISLLRPGGRLGVISFHSLEDTLVKNALHVAAQNCLCPPQQPLCTCAHRASLRLISRKAIKPDAAETHSNPRARSARLRVAEKLEQPLYHSSTSSQQSFT